jgi:hypothetical protein
MLTVYLDQAKWIDLSRAKHGRPDGVVFIDALEAAREAVSGGLVQFPLSMGHYIETWRAPDSARRRRLAQTMIELSQAATLARPPDLYDNELDGLISRAIKVAPPRVSWPPFGWGFGHASGSVRDIPRPQIVLELERLAERPEGFSAYGGGHRDFGDLYRDGERGLATGRDADARSRREQEGVIAASAIMEISENIGWALSEPACPRMHLVPSAWYAQIYLGSGSRRCSTKYCRWHGGSSPSCPRATQRCVYGCCATKIAQRAGNPTT